MRSILNMSFSICCKFTYKCVVIGLIARVKFKNSQNADLLIAVIGVIGGCDRSVIGKSLQRFA